MFQAHFKRVLLVLTVTSLALLPSARAQMAGKAPVLREMDTMTVDDKGDSVYTGKVTFPTESAYSQVKGNFPNPYILLRNIVGSKSKAQLTDATVSYDDSTRSLRLGSNVLGAAVCKRNKWRLEVGKNSELLHVDGHTAILVNATGEGDSTMVVSAKVQLPATARNIKVEPETGYLVYELDREAKNGPVNLDTDLKVKPRIMSALYKIYGNTEFANGMFWTAKTVFNNTGTGDIQHLKVSYRIGDYAQWSPPVEYSLVAPGGHVVDLYFPLLSKETAELKSQTPVDLEVKYSYTDSAGKEYSDTASRRITILGGNGFEYSNSAVEERTNTWADNFSNNPLLAAFVTKMDEPVRAFSGLAAKLSNGQPAGKNDEAAILFCKALYDLEVANGISYQWSVGLLTDNGGASQELKYPRDVLRDKSGTCIELALLYASVCESAGLHCYVMLIPGHAFPVVQLPSGGILPVESTGISGPALNQKHPDPYTFAEAVECAQYEFGHREMGKFALINVDTTQAQGVLCPELPKLPADIVGTWGYKLPRAAAAPAPHQQQQVAAEGNGQEQPQQQPQEQPQPRQDNPQHPAALCGVWEARVRMRNGGVAVMIMQLAPSGRYVSSGSAPGLNPVKFQGTWQIGEESTMIFRNETTNTTENDQITLDGDTLTLTNQNAKVRYSRRN